MDLKIVVNRLGKDELLYELAFRGITNIDTVRKMRKSLRNIMKLERQVDDVTKMHYPKYPFSFTDDMRYVAEKITEIEKLIQEVAADDKSPAYEKISTKLAHTYQRASRAVTVEETELAERQRVLLSLLNLQSDLKSRVRRFKKVSQASQVPIDISILMSSTEITSDSDTDCSSEGNILESLPANLPDSHRIEVDPSLSKLLSVPVYKWDIEKFDGGKSTISLCAFLEQVEELRVSRNVSTEQLFRSAGDLFTGKAKVWYKGMKDRVNSWEELVRELRLQYLGSNAAYNKELLQEIRRRSQHPDEPIGIYVACMNTLFNRLTVPINDKARLEILLENLAPYYKRELGMRDITSVDQLIQLGRRAEANKKAIESYTPPPRHKNFLEPDLAYIYTDEEKNSTTSISREVGASSTPTNIVCWNCRNSGHRSGNCPSTTRNKYCFKCGNANYTVRTCPKCNSGNPRRRR